MLEKLADWYRIANIQPEETIIRKREQAIGKIIPLFEGEKKDYTLQLAAIAAISSNFDLDADLSRQLISKIRIHDKTFQTNPAEVQMELRVCCAVALGEIMHIKKIDSWAPELIAGALKSAFGLRKSHSVGKHFENIIVDLQRVAEGVLEQEARRVRTPGEETIPILIDPKKRFKKLNKKLEEEEPNGTLDKWDELQPVIEELLKSQQEYLESKIELIADQQKVDQEELEVLWWHYAGISKITQKSISKMKSGQTALCSAYELANLMQLPPLSNAKYLLEDTVQKGRSKSSTKIALKNIVEDWDQATISAISTDNSLITTNPVIFPISWLINRCKEDGVTSGWEDAFSNKTSIPFDVKLKLAEWANQIFREQVALGMYQRAIED